MNQPLTLPRLPGRIDAMTTAQLLGFQEHDIAILMKSKLLKPLGNPVQNSPKWFASSEIQLFASDKEWLSKATKAISDYWKKKNLMKRNSFTAPLS